MDAGLVCELLRWATAADDGKLELPDETTADPVVVATLGLLVEQHWLAEDGTRSWTVTPAGRFWFQSQYYGNRMKFHEYGSAVFLLHVASSGNETIVWHKGRFATISVEFIPQPEHFEVRKENEPTTTFGGVEMQEALAVACGLLAEDLEGPQPLQPEELRLHMLKYLNRL